jgi:hypothetical protein
VTTRCVLEADDPVAILDGARPRRGLAPPFRAAGTSRGWRTEQRPKAEAKSRLFLASGREAARGDDATKDVDGDGRSVRRSKERQGGYSNDWGRFILQN